MKFEDAIDRYLETMRAQGRISTPPSERAYRDTLLLHASDSHTDDPRKTTRDDVLRTLARWPHPNTQRNRHSLISSFYRWLVREGKRKDNPAEQIDRARRRPADVIRLKRDEALAVLMAVETRRERWAIYLDLLAGVRNQELRGLQGRHFKRPGLIRITPDIGKGGRPRWLPVPPELRPIADEIARTVGDREYVIPAQRRDPNRREWFDLPTEMASGQAHWRLVRRVAERAGVTANPHALRRAFADIVKRESGDLQVVQRLLGHSSLATTELYLSEPTLDELEAAIADMSFNSASSSRKLKRSDTESMSNTRSRPSRTTSTASSSVSFSISTRAQSMNAPSSRDVPPRGFEPRVASGLGVVRLGEVIAGLRRSPVLREAAERMALHDGS